MGSIPIRFRQLRRETPFKSGVFPLMAIRFYFFINVPTQLMTELFFIYTPLFGFATNYSNFFIEG